MKTVEDVYRETCKRVDSLAFLLGMLLKQRKKRKINQSEKYFLSEKLRSEMRLAKLIEDYLL